ncbi:hypothetical protein NB037_12520 [Rathayibacter sp. ZW T2_19]|uniref:Uncharacterized protein n=1 Tax=Rathayibacter rubneri TaxID=2950106 RepID=A0A9X2ITQ3_9MICO|nr:hypothetical protein [Rathayibacter rubneri]MCM6763242.1 hypothetical protein [Rathayibacter rubneri]
MVFAVAPYRTPRAGTITWSVPDLLDGETWVPLGEEIEGWDPSIDLIIRGSVEIDPQAIETETGLTLAEMALVVSWSCSSSRFRAAAPRQALAQSGVTSFTVTLPGDRLDGKVEVTTAVVALPRADVGAGTARRRGSVLADRRFTVALEGTVGMFPVEIVDFVKTRLPNKASWHLETSQDLDQTFLAGFRLQINERDTELTKAIGSRKPNERERMLLDALEEGVLGLLLESASMLQHELAEETRWEEETVGYVLYSLLTRADDLGTVPTAPAELAMWRAEIMSKVRGLGVGRQIE